MLLFNRNSATDPVCGMKVNPKTAIKLTIDNETYYFCSEYCRKKFIENKGLLPATGESPNVPVKTGTRHGGLSPVKCSSCSPENKKGKWYTNKVIIITSILVLLCMLSYAIPILVPFRNSLWMYTKILWWAVLLGLLLGGVIDRFIPRQYISKTLASPKKSTIIYSVMLGFLMSACSHGILALSMELHKKGASNPAVVSFLLASPWANVSITIMLISFFGLKAFYIILSAIFIAVSTGFIYQFLETKNLIEINKNISAVAPDFSIMADLRKRLKNHKFTPQQLLLDIKGVIEGSVALSNMVLWWILIGVGLSSLISAYVPSHLLHNYMGPTQAGLFITLAAATIIEVCSEGSSPIAFEIYRQTGAFGNSFVFLMAGVVTDYTEIGLIWSNLGKKSAIWLPVITVPQVILFGWIANHIFH